MISNFSQMLAFLEAQAKSTTGIVDFRHVGSAEFIIERIQKYYSSHYEPGACLFLDTSEGVLQPIEYDIMNISFVLGVTVLMKPNSNDPVEQDAIWSETLDASIRFFSKLKEQEAIVENSEWFECGIIENKLHQVSKITNSNAMGWRNEIIFTYNIDKIFNHCNCN